MISVLFRELQAETLGAWLTDIDGEGDVHCYLASDAVVIGLNDSYKDKTDCSDIAVVIEKEGVRLQLANGKDVSSVKVREATLAKALRTLLGTLKADAEEMLKNQGSI